MLLNKALVPDLNFARPIVTALRRQRVSYDYKAIVREKGLGILDTLGDWLSDPSASFSLRQCMQFILEGDHFEVPSNLVSRPEKIAKREKLLSEVSSLWTKVINNKCSLYESLKSNSTESILLSKLVRTLDELLSMYNGNPPNNFLEVIGRILQPWNKPSKMFQEVSTLIGEVRGRFSSGQGSVRIMSMYMAKGLEADYVFVVGLNEGIFPKKGAKQDEIEEAGRLLFVSMSRAKVELYLCHARTRSAAITHLPNSFALKPSPFIKEIPKDLLETKYIPGESTPQNKSKRVKDGVAQLHKHAIREIKTEQEGAS